MKTLIIIGALLLSQIQTFRHFDLVSFHDNKITFEYDSSNHVSYKIHKEDTIDYFEIKDLGKVYLNSSLSEEYINEIKKVISAEFVYPKINSATMETINLAIIVDNTGKIHDFGFKKKAIKDYYNKEIVRILNESEIQLNPIIINGKRVNFISSLLIEL